MQLSRSRSRRLALPAAGAIFVLLYLFAWPFVKLFAEGFLTADGTFTFENFLNLLKEASFRQVIVNTMAVNMGGTLFAALLGMAAAWVMAYTDIPCKRFLHKLLLIPLVIPGYIITLAWMQTLGQGSFLFRLTHFPLYSRLGIVFLFGVCNYPLLYLLILSNLRKISRELEQAARVSGCKGSGVFLRVTLPLSVGTLANAMLLIFLSCLDNFGIVAFIGIPANITVLSTDIYKSITSFSENSFSGAAVRAVVLSLITFGLMWTAGRVAALVHWAEGEKEDMKARCFLGKLRLPVFALMLLILAFINIVPFLTLFTTSLTKAIGVPFRPDTVTLANFVKIWKNTKCMNGFKNSVLLASAASLLCACLGIGVSYGAVRRKSRICAGLQHLLTFPYSIPGIILGLAVILAFAKPFFGIRIYGTLWILLLAYVIRFTAVVLRACNTAFSTLDGAMEEAGRSCGAGAAALWKRVILPLAGTPVVSGMGLVFLSSLMELTTSSILWSAGSETVGVVIFNFTSAGKTNLASAYSVMVLLFAAAGFLAAKLLEYGLERAKRSLAAPKMDIISERSIQI